MANLGRAFKRAAKALVSKEPSQFKAEGKKILCSHCGADYFAKGEAQLNTAGMTFIDLDWANKSATTLACAKCGRIEWFLKKPEEVS